MNWTHHIWIKICANYIMELCSLFYSDSSILAIHFRLRKSIKRISWTIRKNRLRFLAIDLERNLFRRFDFNGFSFPSLCQEMRNYLQPYLRIKWNILNTLPHFSITNYYRKLWVNNIIGYLSNFWTLTVIEQTL